MRFTKIDEPAARAAKLSSTGALYYDCWNDEYGALYVQIVKNVGGGGAGTGTFSSDLYAFDSIGDGKQINGYDPATGIIKSSSDNNMSAFLRAIRMDIIRRRDEQSKD